MYLDHIAVFSKDLSRDVKWYKDKFECNVRYQDSTWALIAFDNVSLALVTEKEHPTHFALVDPGVKENQKVKQHRDGIFYIYERDPSGNVVEIIDRNSN